MQIGDVFRMVLAFDKARNGFHGTGTVQGNNGRDVFNILRLQPNTHTGHARRFHLKHAAGLAPREHLIGFRIFLRNLFQPEFRLMLLQHF